MREAQEGKGFRLAQSRRFRLFGRKRPEPQEPGLIRVKLQVEPCETFSQVRQEPLGLLPMLKAHHEVVRVPHDNHVAVRLRLSPVVGPEVEHIMKVDICQQWADVLPPCGVPSSTCGFASRLPARRRSTTS